MTRSFRNLFGKTTNQSNVNSPYNIRAPEKSTVSCTNSPLMQGGRLNERDEINNSEVAYELNSPNIFLKDMTQQIDNSQGLPTRFETETDELDSAYIPKTSSEGKRIISQIQLKERGQVICHSNNTSLVLDNLPLEKSNSTLQPSHSRINEEKIEKKFLSIISLSRLDLQQNTNHLNLVHNDKAVSMEIKDEQNLKAALAAKLKARDYQPKVYSKPTDL